MLATKSISSTLAEMSVYSSLKCQQAITSNDMEINMECANAITCTR